MSAIWKRVLATHEERQTLSTGDWLGDHYPGVALPSTKALGKWVEIRIGDRWTPARVMDVGPWCIDDHDYVFTDNIRPRAEKFKGTFCPKMEEEFVITPHDFTPCNGAGIDLFPETAKALGIKLSENMQVDWRFLDI